MRPLVLAWGNRSRGDDALGPLLLDRIADLQQLDRLEDYQLLPEHLLDLEGRPRLLFVDASTRAAAPYALTPLGPAADPSLSSHRLSPAALLQAYARLQGRAPPPATLLAIRGESFELGAPLSAAAERHLDAAEAWLRRHWSPPC